VVLIISFKGLISLGYISICKFNSFIYNETIVMDPKQIIQLFDDFLADKKASFSGVIIGGSALVLMGTTHRNTEDVDVLSPPIPLEILNYAEEFRNQLTYKGIKMVDQWFNNGPDSLLNALPKDWKKNTTSIFKGRALTLSTLGRIDLLRSKLWALCDRREQDREDLLSMRPSSEELNKCLPWVQDQDTNPEWPDYVETRFKALAKDLGYEL